MPNLPDQGSGRPRRAALYLRAAANAQGCDTMEADRGALQAFCAAAGYRVVGVHRDACAATVPLTERPSWCALVDQAQRGEVDVVVVRGLDRVGRDTATVGEAMELLGAAGAVFHTTEHGPHGTLLAFMLMAETETIADRACASGRGVAR